MMHAGGVFHQSGQETAAALPHHVQKQLTPLAGRKSIKAWGAALLETLPQAFQVLAARWGLATCEKQDSPSLQSPSLSSASAPDVESHMSQHQHNMGRGWTSDTSSCRLPQLQLCLTSSFAAHRPDAKPIPSHRTSGSLAVKRVRSASRDEESHNKRRAITEGDAKTGL